MSDELQTINPDQIQVANAIPDGAYVLIQVPGAPLQRLPYNQLLIKLINTDLISGSEAALQLDLAWAEDSVALVDNDPDPLKCGWWRKTGAIDAGNWVQFEQLSKAVLAAAQTAYDELSSSVDNISFLMSESLRLWGASKQVWGNAAGARVSERGLQIIGDASRRDIWGSPGTVSGSAMGARRTDTRVLAPYGSVWGAPKTSLLNRLGARLNERTVRGLADAHSLFLARQAAIRSRRAVFGIAGDPDWSILQRIGGLLHIISFGQSLSTGEAAGGNTVVGPLAYAKSFLGGPRPQDGGADRFDSLIPYGEIGNRETPLGGCFMMLAQLLAQEYEIDAATMGQIFLGSAPGKGGVAAVDLFNAADIIYPRLEDNITYGAARAADLGYSYSPAAILYKEGEATYQYGDADGTLGGVTYHDALVNGQAAIEAHAQSVTGGAKPLPFIMYQTATHLFYDKVKPALALEQLNLALTDNNFAMSTPTHFFRFVAQPFPAPYTGKRVHLHHTSYAWLGAYDALALWSWIFHGIKPLPLSPVDSWRNGNVVSLRYKTGDRRLVWDRNIPNPGNFGFTVVNSAGDPLAIAAAPRIVGRDVVEITLSAAATAGLKVRAGWIGDGSRGICCLRDDSGDALTFDLLGKPMHRWAPISETTVA